MLVSDMQNKDIINQTTGSNLGRIIDIDILENGTINYFIVGNLKVLKKLSSKEYKINFNEITKIGNDVILVDLK